VGGGGHGAASLLQVKASSAGLGSASAHQWGPGTGAGRGASSSRADGSGTGALGGDAAVTARPPDPAGTRSRAGSGSRSGMIGGFLPCFGPSQPRRLGSVTALIMPPMRTRPAPRMRPDDVPSRNVSSSAALAPSSGTLWTSSPTIAMPNAPDASRMTLMTPLATPARRSGTALSTYITSGMPRAAPTPTSMTPGISSAYPSPVRSVENRNIP